MKLSPREYFPRGLVQPQGSFRFSRDALLLADYVSAMDLPPQACIADLGTGCGVIGLGLALKRPDWQVFGLENNLQLAEAAAHNAKLLALPNFTALAGDINASGVLKMARSRLNRKPTDQFDAVVCNPPWQRRGHGRIPPSPAKAQALFGTDATYSEFFTAADYLLGQHGRMITIAAGNGVERVLAALPARLRPVRLSFIHPCPDKPAVFFILEARKNSRSMLRVDPPAFLELIS